MCNKVVLWVFLMGLIMANQSVFAQQASQQPVTQLDVQSLIKAAEIYNKNKAFFDNKQALEAYQRISKDLSKKKTEGK